MEKKIDVAQILAFHRFLKEDEREVSTIEKYLRDVRVFSEWLENRPVSKEVVSRWKEHLFFSGMGGLSGEIPQDPTQDVPQH